MTIRIASVSFALALVIALGCGSEAPPTESPDAAAPPAPCPAGRGPSMVRIPMAEGRTACIDSTEVTRDQYAAFLGDSSAHGAGSRVDGCGTAPYRDDPDPSCVTDPVVCKNDCGRHPQVCVTHCNAQAFCKWAGKKLCGILGGGPTTAESLGDARVSSWVSACGGGSHATGAPAREYAYGRDFDATKCNTETRPGSGCKASPTSCGTVPVGSLEGCQGAGPYAGIFDMSGNVHEWIALTDANATAINPQSDYVGGSFEKAVFDPRRDYSCLGGGGSASAVLALANVGFRCCAD